MGPTGHLWGLYALAERDLGVLGDVHDLAVVEFAGVGGVRVSSATPQTLTMGPAGWVPFGANLRPHTVITPRERQTPDQCVPTADRRAGHCGVLRSAGVRHVGIRGRP